MPACLERQLEREAGIRELDGAKVSQEVSRGTRCAEVWLENRSKFSEGSRQWGCILST